jgi:hypothetical protein
MEKKTGDDDQPQWIVPVSRSETRRIVHLVKASAADHRVVGDRIEWTRKGKKHAMRITPATS